ncbi:TIR domain-containing protein [Steroidobacter agaridevorans]|uniref:TIR domain-containing protein n=1 Tax=Steroidobacter agaridevorans TaxID=2695856 RepID=UPI0013217B96|nr:TIR domain-containing protein [Steroidobacter agaridevorans]GFE87311.1 cyclic nucleotide-binding protein [Steroidobacter agaridevorans]
MLERFAGEQGRRLRIEALTMQRIVAGDRALAEELADACELRALAAGEVLIRQNESDNDVYFILAGAADILINGRPYNRRHAGECVGEMAAVEPIQRRSASVIAHEDSVVGKVTESQLTALGQRHPDLWRQLARLLARRLAERNALIARPRERVRLFVISSVECLEVARAIENAFAHDPFLTILWTDGVFRVTNYTLQDLEDQVDQSDFAVAIAHSDDLTHSREQTWPAPRDNVIFELGLFMGRLGRNRAILMEPREEKLKLPSDLAGVHTIAYRYERGQNAAALMAPACNALRDHIMRLGCIV